MTPRAPGPWTSDLRPWTLFSRQHRDRDRPGASVRAERGTALGDHDVGFRKALPDLAGQRLGEIRRVAMGHAEAPLGGSGPGRLEKEGHHPPARRVEAAGL